MEKLFREHSGSLDVGCSGISAPSSGSMGTTEAVLGMCSFTFVSRGTSSASQDCHIKNHKQGSMKQQIFTGLLVLETRSLKSRGGQHRCSR